MNDMNPVSAGAVGRRAMIFGTGALALLAGVRAARADAGAADAAAPIQSLDAALLAAMRSGGSIGFSQRMAMLMPALDHALDLPAILRASVGPASWSAMPPADQASLLQAFRRYTAANYASNFNSYDNQSFTVAGTRALPDGRVVVQTRLSRPGGTEHRIDYVMRRSVQGWKAVDVLADGSISRVAVQRSDFSTALASGGATRLTALLAAKADALA